MTGERCEVYGCEKPGKGLCKDGECVHVFCSQHMDAHLKKEGFVKA